LALATEKKETNKRALVYIHSHPKLLGRGRKRKKKREGKRIADSGREGGVIGIGSIIKALANRTKPTSPTRIRPRCSNWFEINALQGGGVRITLCT
jgi:hypothetical protein